MKKVAILGATGYIGKSLAYEMSLEKDFFTLFLFSRSEDKLLELKSDIAVNEQRETIIFYTLDAFDSFEYDVIINCTGMSDMATLQENKEKILTITKQVDSMIITYLEKKENTLYINMSSGAIYNAPEILSSTSTVSEYYAFSKKEIEEKHRSLHNLPIIDIRIFSFFSRFVDVQAHFLLSEIIYCLKNKKVFETNGDDILRDYIVPKDLFTLIKIIIEGGKRNDFFDTYSREPVSKFKLLDFLKERLGIEYVIKESLDGNKGLSKNSYYADNKKAGDVLGYSPVFSSIEGIIYEVERMQ